MKAVTYQGPYELSLDDVPDARIEAPTDAVIKLTSTNICGSDLPMYEGRTDVEQGKVLGHENMGTVEAVGDAVDRVRVGDRVSLPFNIACGTCKNCAAGFTGFCLRANPPGAGAAYGYAAMGPYDGGQAEYLRVPWADFNCLELPPGTEHELDYTMLSDVFPTGYHGCELAGVGPGDTATVMGAGPVGLLAAYSAILRGASQVSLVDKEVDRLTLGVSIGATAINLADGDPVEQILDATDGEGTDRGVGAVGYQAHDATGEEHPAMALDSLVQAVRPTGSLGVVGVYVPQDPGGVDDAAKEGRINFDYGSFWFKGQHMGTGQCNTKAYNRHLRDLITVGRAKPSFIVSHEVGLDDAVDAYDKFDKRVDGYTKVILHPAA